MKTDQLTKKGLEISYQLNHKSLKGNRESLKFLRNHDRLCFKSYSLKITLSRLLNHQPANYN